MILNGRSGDGTRIGSRRSRLGRLQTGRIVVESAVARSPAGRHRRRRHGVRTGASRRRNAARIRVHADLAGSVGATHAGVRSVRATAAAEVGKSGAVETGSGSSDAVRRRRVSVSVAVPVTGGTRGGAHRGGVGDRRRAGAGGEHWLRGLGVGRLVLFLLLLLSYYLIIALLRGYVVRSYLWQVIV